MRIPVLEFWALAGDPNLAVGRQPDVVTWSPGPILPEPFDPNRTATVAEPPRPSDFCPWSSLRCRERLV